MANTINSMTSLATGGADPTAGSATGATPNKELSKDLFLKLMMAQLKNQNPLNPVDGTDFLAQLSQISGVEQMVAMRKQLEDIGKILGAQVPTTAPNSHTPAAT